MKKNLFFLASGILSSATISFFNQSINYKNTETTEVKSTYTYHSGWSERGFEDTVLLTTIYKKVDQLLLENVKDISISTILWKIDPNNYINFGNYETILDDVNNYIHVGKVNPSYYQNMHLYGDEKYSWDWGKACPEYTWSWTYKNNVKSVNLYTYYNYGYGNANHSVYFKFSISYN